MIKKIIAIYLVGVILSFGMGFNNIYNSNKKYNLPFTYGDLALITSLSLLSWSSVFAFSIVEISDLDFWDKEI